MKVNKENLYYEVTFGMKQNWPFTINTSDILIEVYQW